MMGKCSRLQPARERQTEKEKGALIMQLLEKGWGRGGGVSVCLGLSLRWCHCRLPGPSAFGCFPNERGCSRM